MNKPSSTYPDDEQLRSLSLDAIARTGAGLCRFLLEDASILFLDRNILRIFDLDTPGVDPRDFAGRPARDLCPPTPDSPDLITQIRNAAGALHSFHYRFATHSGLHRWALVDSWPLHDENLKRTVVQCVIRDITECKEPEESLRLSEERFRLMAAVIEVAFWISDRDTARIHYVSPAFHKLYGVPCERLYEDIEVWLERIHPNDIDRVLRTIGEKHGTQHEIRYRIIRTDGVVRWIRNVIFPVFRPDGQLSHIAGFAEDITDRVHAETLLRDANERLQATLDAVPDLYFEIDDTGTFIDYHAPFPERLFAPPENFLGKKFHDLLPPEVAQKISDGIASLRRENKKTSFAYTLPIDGLARSFECTMVPKGKVLGTDGRIIAFVRDVTETRRSEQAARDALSRFESVVNSTPLVAIQGFNRDGLILHWNPMAHKLYGFTPDEAVGRPLQHLLLSDDEVQPFLDEVHSIWDSGTASEPREWPVRTRSGESRWVLSSMFPVFEHGAVSEVFCMDIDITQRRLAEDKLLRAKQETEFYLDIMSHDLTNHNQNLLGNLGLLMRDLDPGDRRSRLLDNCRRQVDKIESLISKVRAFSLVKQMASVQPVPVDLNRMISDSLRLVANLYPRKNLDIRFDTSSPRTALATDLLDSVLTNVIENAVKHSPHDSVLLDISIDLPESSPSDFWQIRIADNGHGVPDEMKEKIFDRYARIGREKGMGLGLSLARVIMEKHGGAISVRDRVPGDHRRGSVFCILIPRG